MRFLVPSKESEHESSKESDAVEVADVEEQRQASRAEKTQDAECETDVS